MTLTETLTQLAALGTARNRELFPRQGVRGALFGVSASHLRTLARRIGIDQLLAESLWDTGNHDARMLATLLADPRLMSMPQLLHWARAAGNFLIADALSALAANMPLTLDEIDRLCDSGEEWISTIGWNLIAQRAATSEQMPNEFFATRLRRIEREIHTRPNRTRHAMNAALIAIGRHRTVLRKSALAVARGLGDLRIDHGDTAAVTPDALAEIRALEDRGGRRAAPRRPRTGARAKRSGASKLTARGRPLRRAKRAAGPARGTGARVARSPRGASESTRGGSRRPARQTTRAQRGTSRSVKRRNGKPPRRG